VLAVSLVVLALVVAITGTTWGMLRATDAEAVAVSETKQKDDALRAREAALADATGQLFLALVNQARAERSSGRVGQRFKAIEAIRAAARKKTARVLPIHDCRAYMGQSPYRGEANGRF
jgi:hypothetical protein